MKKLRILIIEDEAPSAKKLLQYLESINPEFQILGVLKSIRTAIDWLQSNPEPDIIFLDINLSDGLSFHIFEKIKINSFIIFLTAHEQYAIQAFELNSIDYVLKPFSQTDIQKSLNKLDRRVRQNSLLIAESLIQSYKVKEQYKSRFLVKKGKKISSIPTEQVSYFFKSDLVFLVKEDGIKYAIEFTMEQLEEVLSPALFFRLNRQFIANINYIKHIEKLNHNRLQVHLIPAFKDPIIVSQKKSGEFKRWLNE